ncbi:MAG: glycoside hydrolase family 5 protein [Thermotogota bacterium]|nr:glycoside hydrolase family 5 protein [Thermotogota bacterium]
MAKIFVLLIIAPFIFFPGCSENTTTIPVSPIGKGINIGGALEANTEGAWGLFIEDWFFDEIVNKGFETVRFPVRWTLYTSDNPPYTIDEQFILRVEQVVQQALERDLKVVINVHNFEELMNDPDGNADKFYSIWEQIATNFKDYSDDLYFELLNEPEGNLSAEKWNVIQLETIKRTRAIQSDRWIMITGAPDGLSASLYSIILPDNTDYIMATFHLYEPYLFTHQGAPWLDERFQTTGIQWPGPPDTPVIPVQAAQDDPLFEEWFENYNTVPYIFNPAGPKPIAQELKRAHDWSWQNKIPVLMGEFGTYNIIDETSRANWTQFVYQKAQEYTISWMLWGFAGTFGVFDLDTREWNEAIIGSLFGQEYVHER